MRITILLPTVSMAGGIRVAAIYADRLSRRGHIVHLVSTYRRLTWKQTARQFVRTAQWCSVVPPGQSHVDALGDIHTIIPHAGPLTDKDVPDADVILATWWETAEWVASLSPSKGAKIYFVQGDEPGFVDVRNRSRAIATWHMPLSKITISRFLVDQIRNRCGDKDVACVPNSVDREQFNAPQRSKQKTPTIGLLYNAHACKGCEVSLAAYHRLRVAMPEARLVVLSALEPVRRLPLPKTAEVFVSPPQSQIREIYARCDVWMCGSRLEGFHLPPLEAMACRCPVVSTRVGGPLDVVRDGINGYLVDVDDANSLADRVLQVLRLDHVQWETMSDAALATVANYSWDDAASQLEQILVSIANSSGVKRSGDTTDFMQKPASRTLPSESWHI